MKNIINISIILLLVSFLFLGISNAQSITTNGNVVLHFNITSTSQVIPTNGTVMPFSLNGNITFPNNGNPITYQIYGTLYNVLNTNSEFGYVTTSNHQSYLISIYDLALSVSNNIHTYSANIKMIGSNFTEASGTATWKSTFTSSVNSISIGTATIIFKQLNTTYLNSLQTKINTTNDNISTILNNITQLYYNQSFVNTKVSMLQNKEIQLKLNTEATLLNMNNTIHSITSQSNTIAGLLQSQVILKTEMNNYISNISSLTTQIGILKNNTTIQNEIDQMRANQQGDINTLIYGIHYTLVIAVVGLGLIIFYIIYKENKGRKNKPQTNENVKVEKPLKDEVKNEE